MRSIARSTALAGALVCALAGTCHAAGVCDPIVPENCLLPFPNNFYMADGKVALTSASLPVDNKNVAIRPDYGLWNMLDGFSGLQPIVTYLENATVTNCAPFWNIAASLESSSPVVMLNANTGKTIPHWVEMDHSSDVDKGNGSYPRAILIWPAQRLPPSTRIIVALRDIATADGAIIPPSEAFRALRDGLPSSDPDVNNRRALFKDIFGHLSSAGVNVSSLQQAWDFTTVSQEAVSNAMVAVRDDALSRVAPANGGFNFTILSSQDNYNEHVYRKIEGQFMAPWYLNRAGPGPLVRLARDANGVPQYQGVEPVNFTMLIPRSLVNNGTQGRVLQYGHGLFGSRDEVESGYLDAQADEYGYVLIASDWIGLAEEDEVWVAYMMGQDLSNFTMVPDRCTQGMLNALLTMRLTLQELASHPSTMVNGTKTIDPSLRSYYGNSQGGILGGVYTAVSTDVTRGVLGVPGAPYALLLPRSVDFTPLGQLLWQRYDDAIDRAVLFGLFQMLWDHLEPAGYVDAVTKHPLPGNTPSHVLVHYGLGDAQVTWLGAQTLARSVGAVMFSSNVREGNETFFGFENVTDSTVVQGKNVIVGWDFGAPTVPFVNVPANKEFDAHGKPRKDPRAQLMMDGFFRTGQVTNTCGGACTSSGAHDEAVASSGGARPHVWAAAQLMVEAERRGELTVELPL